MPSAHLGGMYLCSRLFAHTPRYALQIKRTGCCIFAHIHSAHNLCLRSMVCGAHLQQQCMDVAHKQEIVVPVDVQLRHVQHLIPNQQL